MFDLKYLLSFNLLYSPIIILLTLPLLVLSSFTNIGKTTDYLTKIKHIKYYSYKNNNTPCGWVISNTFIGYCFADTVRLDGAMQYTLYYIAVLNIDSNTIFIYSPPKKTDYTCTLQETAKLKKLQITPRKNQTHIITETIDIFQKKGTVMTLLYGDSGSGKSTIGLLLCDQLRLTSNVMYYEFNLNSFKDHTFNDVYNSRKNSCVPFVILMDEIDIAIDRLHHDEVKINTAGDPVYWLNTKYDWNTFLDKFNKGLYQNIIVIMTTNKKLEWFNELDVSYIRQGRIDSKYKMDKNHIKDQ